MVFRCENGCENTQKYYYYKKKFNVSQKSFIAIAMKKLPCHCPYSWYHNWW
jgi:hypothetical protein